MSAFEQELLRACLDDDVPLLAAARLVRAELSTAAPAADWAARRARMLSMLSDLAQRGLIELGNSAAGRFRAWSNTGRDADERLAALVRLDEPDDQHAGWAFAAWIRTTQRGDDAAFRLIERESCLDDGRALASMRALASERALDSDGAERIAEQ